MALASVNIGDRPNGVFRQCPVKGHAAWVYERVKAESLARIHALAIMNFFALRQTYATMDDAMPLINAHANHVESVSVSRQEGRIIIPTMVRMAMALDRMLPEDNADESRIAVQDMLRMAATPSEGEVILLQKSGRKSSDRFAVDPALALTGVQAIPSNIKSKLDHEGLAYRELDEDDEFPVRSPAQHPRGRQDDDEFKETLVDWFASEAEAQERQEEKIALWLNRRRNEVLDRIERAHRGIPAGDNAEKPRMVWSSPCSSRRMLRPMLAAWMDSALVSQNMLQLRMRDEALGQILPLPMSP
jgi:hypothetical protein